MAGFLNRIFGKQQPQNYTIKNGVRTEGTTTQTGSGSIQVSPNYSGCVSANGSSHCFEGGQPVDSYTPSEGRDQSLDDMLRLQDFSRNR